MSLSLSLFGIAAAVQVTTGGERHRVKRGDERSRTRRLGGGSTAAVATRVCLWNSWSPLSLRLIAREDKLLHYLLHFDSDPPFIILVAVFCWSCQNCCCWSVIMVDAAAASQ
ncbi:uncharacterized protein LOC110267946 [Arachis ipaensis]|uniref:uncharacterized protein LOC110267946 n=1 Tax=Arachis ipaensis TaxID=130454 RepID=UPI000A2B6A52|nr:uncharacterized protein LOC110267946 [Arachis ipaensis]